MLHYVKRQYKSRGVGNKIRAYAISKFLIPHAKKNAKTYQRGGLNEEHLGITTKISNSKQKFYIRNPKVFLIAYFKTFVPLYFHDMHLLKI